MIPAPFEYQRVEFVDHAIQLLADHPDAKVLAGGHSLLPLMKLRLARPSLLVDISRIRDLSVHPRGRRSRSRSARSPGTTISRRARLLQSMCPIVAYTASEIGDPQVRHMGTIGGSIAHADPASDLPTVMVALGAEFAVRGPQGATRNVPASDLLPRSVRARTSRRTRSSPRSACPKTAGRGWSYLKFHRRAQDWALVGVAALVGQRRSPRRSRSRT